MIQLSSAASTKVLSPPLICFIFSSSRLSHLPLDYAARPRSHQCSMLPPSPPAIASPVDVTSSPTVARCVRPQTAFQPHPHKSHVSYSREPPASFFLPPQIPHRRPPPCCLLLRRRRRRTMSLASPLPPAFCCASSPDPPNLHVGTSGHHSTPPPPHRHCHCLGHVYPYRSSEHASSIA